MNLLAHPGATSIPPAHLHPLPLSFALSLSLPHVGVSIGGGQDLRDISREHFDHFHSESLAEAEIHEEGDQGHTHLSERVSRHTPALVRCAAAVQRHPYCASQPKAASSAGELHASERPVMPVCTRVCTSFHLLCRRIAVCAAACYAAASPWREMRGEARISRLAAAHAVIVCRQATRTSIRSN